MAIWRPRYHLERLPRGVDSYYESPATEPKLQGCTKDHAIKVIQIWNDYRIPTLGTKRPPNYQWYDIHKAVGQLLHNRDGPREVTGSLLI